MKNSVLFDQESFTYPGEYAPLFKEGDVQDVVNYVQGHKTVRPPVNIAETPDSYRIEVAMPGVERENILLLGREHTISLMGRNNTCSIHNEEHSQQHEFDYDCFSREIPVAGNADLEFANAVCHSGMLRIYVPKATTNFENKSPVNIIVY